MAYPVWQPGKIYAPGAIVRPITTPDSVVTPPIFNGTFESGNVGWRALGDVNGTNFQPRNVGTSYSGAWAAVCNNAIADGSQLRGEQSNVTVTAGVPFKCSVWVRRVSGSIQAAVGVAFFNASGARLGGFAGFTGTSYTAVGTSWQKLEFSGTVPATATRGQPIIGGALAAGILHFDNFAWSFDNTPAGAAGLVFKAVQPAAATSAGTEPDWPAVNGQTVVDGGVTWEALIVKSVTWTAYPIAQSSTTEPIWPTTPGETVLDGSVEWTTVTRNIADPKCPNSKVVTIAASKIFAADRDIVAFSATVNPLDWSSPDDAGYLPVGLQQYGANKVSALGLYRGNVVVWSSSTFQMWQVDEDPQGMALLDAMEGVGSTYPKAVQPVSNDLFFLTSLGVRTIGIAASSTNMQAGDIGMPIDPLVQAKLATFAGEPRGFYFPAQGQYWLVFDDEAFVYTMTRMGDVGAWSRYTFPFAIKYATQLDDDLYIRSATQIYRVDVRAVRDGMTTLGDLTGTAFTGTIQWPWLDFGAPGVTKMLVGFDNVGTGTGSVEFGYSQTNQAVFTPAWSVLADSVPGQIMPISLSAPSISVRLTYDGGQAWEWQATSIYLNDNRMTS